MAGFDKVDIHQNIDNTLKLIEHEIKARTEIIKSYGNIPPVACYPAELNQVFMHLLRNATQAIEQTGTITIQTSIEDENVQICIEDDGAGIPSDKIENLFDPDFTKDGTRVKAGLGLFASYNIIKKHKGDIQVESEVGKGTKFTIILPLNLESKKESV
jgi:signal transduction histidine kinase